MKEENKDERTIYQKLFYAKKEFTSIIKDQKNPHFKSAYYDINDLHKMADPVLHNHGLMILNPISEGKITTQILDVVTGEKIESSFNIEYNPNPQKVGSEITYYRRYLLSALLGLQADDDDGNRASEKKLQEKKKVLNAESWEKRMKQISSGELKEDDFKKGLQENGYTITESQKESLANALTEYELNKQ